MILAGSMLSLTHPKAITWQRPIIVLRGRSICGGVAIAHFRPYLYGQRFTLVSDHKPLQWHMELDKLTDKLAMWALLLQEYDLEVVHRVGITNQDAYGLSRNPSPSDGDLTRTRWHRDCDQEAVPCWHAVAYLTLFYFSNAVVEVPMQGSDYEIDRPQAIADIWEDLSVLHNITILPTFNLFHLNF